MATTEGTYGESRHEGEREPRAEAGVMDLLVKLMRDMSELVSRESRLVRAEIGDKVEGLQAAMGLMISGAACLLVAMIILSLAIVTALSEIVGAGWAALIVGVALAIVGAVLAQQGAKRVKPSHLMPERTAAQVREDAQMAREQAR